MNKTIVLVEDNLNPLEDMLLSVQSIMLISSLRGLDNAPKENDTKICILHVLWDGVDNEDERFRGIKYTLEERQCELSKQKNIDLPNIAYEYEPVDLKSDIYLEESDKCKDIICEKIDEICADSNYTILLDVVLNPNKDQQALMEDDQMILSQQLYNAYQHKCIAYTNYGDGDKAFREKWVEKAQGSKIPYERFSIDGNVVYRPFRDDIYSILEIEDSAG